MDFHIFSVKAVKLVALNNDSEVIEGKKSMYLGQQCTSLKTDAKLRQQISSPFVNREIWPKN